MVSRPMSFYSRLDVFLGALPKEFRYSIELRNPDLIGERYAQLLKTHGVAHVYNHWCFMPGLAEQHQRMEAFTAPFTVLRLLTPLKRRMKRRNSGRRPITRLSENYRRCGHTRSRS